MRQLTYSEDKLLTSLNEIKQCDTVLKCRDKSVKNSIVYKTYSKEIVPFLIYYRYIIEVICNVLNLGFDNETIVDAYMDDSKKKDYIDKFNCFKTITFLDFELLYYFSVLAYSNKNSNIKIRIFITRGKDDIFVGIEVYALYEKYNLDDRLKAYTKIHITNDINIDKIKLDLADIKRVIDILTNKPTTYGEAVNLVRELATEYLIMNTCYNEINYKMYNTPNSIISIVQQANELFNITADEAMKFLNKYYKNCLEMTRKKKKNIKKLVNSLYREHVSPEAYIKTITGINESQLYNTLYMYSILYKNLLGNKISEDELYQLCYDQGFLLIDYYKEDESIKDTEIEKFIIEFNNTYK